MSRSKLARFQDIRESENVIEPEEENYRLQGNWKKEFFKNQNPLVVEIGCGKGEYTIGLAREHPDQNFIGIDIKGDRIWVGSQQAQELNLNNVGFLRTQMQFIDRFFGENEVDRFWLTFPDPRPKDRDEKRRLNFPAYMERYKKLLKPDGWFHFKTDNTFLFEYTLELFEAKRVKVKDLRYTFDLYKDEELVKDHFGIQTKYEKLWSDRGELIKYMKFQFEYEE